MHNFSYLRVMFALLIPDGFTQRCNHGITCHCRFRIQYNTHTHTHIRPHTHYLCFASHKPLFRLSLNFVCIWSVTSRSNHIKTWGHLGYANEGQRSNLPLFCISETVGPIEPKFCMGMECDQTIKSHKNINLIWGHLGYANEGQRSNLPLFCISVTLGPIEPRFCVHMECDQANICHNNIKLMRPSWLCKWRSKVKSSFVLYLRNRWSNWA